MKSYLKSNLKVLAVLCLFVLTMFSCSDNTKNSGQDYYAIKMYKLNDLTQTQRVEAFLKNAYIPALHRAGVAKVGVFKPIESDTVSGNIVIVWIPFRSLQEFEGLQQKLDNDTKFQADGADYIEATYDKPPFGRIETTLLKAFSHMPQFAVPPHKTPPSERIYELRSYQGPTEKMFRKKVEMFNEGGEIKIFSSLNFNAVFYAEVIAGSTMPNLMYMTTFPDMKTHDELWNAFRNHPDWKVLSSVEKYKNTVSGIVRYLLHPTDYSEI